MFTKIFKKKKKKYFLTLLVVLVIFLSVVFAALPETERIGKKIYFSAKSYIFPVSKDASVLLAVPYHRQEHALSCEIAALKMALNYYGVKVSESELIRELPFDTKLPRSQKNIWGDPDKGFIGDIDGTMPNTGYGVYEKPIAELAQKYRNAKILTPASLEGILNEVSKKRPVIVWGTLASGKNISWKTAEGKSISAIFGEHTRVVIGFTGTPKFPKKIILHDPVYGTLTMSKNKFLENWRLLGNKAVVVY